MKMFGLPAILFLPQKKTHNRDHKGNIYANLKLAAILYPIINGVSERLSLQRYLS